MFILYCRLGRVSNRLVVDSLAFGCYNYSMIKKKRTARKDSNYVIYMMEDSFGETYIGLTRKGSNTVSRAIGERWRRHVSRARNEQQAWTLYEYLRAGALEHEWTYTVLAVIRGRAEAYAHERSVVLEQRPTLNTQYG